MSKTLYLIRGLPGSGKSSLAAQLVPRENCISADDMPGRYIDGVENPSLRISAQRWCMEQVLDKMRSRITPIAVHNVFVTRKSLNPYFDAAIGYGYLVCVINCEGILLPKARSLSLAQPTHDVPIKAIISMEQRWEPLSYVLNKYDHKN